MMVQLTFPEVLMPLMQQMATSDQAASKQATIGQLIPPESSMEVVVFSVTL